jgi:hypothetical protein
MKFRFPLLGSVKAVHLVPAAVVAGLCLLSMPASAQKSREELLRQADDLIASYRAERDKSALCASYVGKVVTPTAFSTLALKFAPPAPKGEFETTAQYNARVAAAQSRVSPQPVVVAIPVDRSFLNYDADGKLMAVREGAFGAGVFSKILDVQVTAEYFGLIPDDIAKGTPIPHSKTERLLRTYAGQSGLGIPAKVSEIERQSNVIYHAGPRLFSFTRDEDSMVLAFRVLPPQAPAMKQSLKLALAVVPRAPYFFRNEDMGAKPTLAKPVGGAVGLGEAQFAGEEALRHALFIGLQSLTPSCRSSDHDSTGYRRSPHAAIQP